MPDFPRFEYSGKELRRAGKALAGEMIWNDESRDSIIRTFQIANSFRDSHAYPMARLRQEMVGKMRKHHLQGITAARLKRMPSVRRKLRTIPENLNQIQDLGGCRAILASIDDVKKLLDAYAVDPKHEFDDSDDYISRPKQSGYRSHHLIFKFRGEGDVEAFNGRRIELQIRTRLQHSWATAVEAVGLFRSEDMKAGHGNEDWLRLFYLMSSELALAENCPLPESAPPRPERVSELIALDKKLNAISTLEGLRFAMRGADGFYPPSVKNQYFLVTFDSQDTSVRIQLYSKAISGAKAYDEAEGVRDQLGGSRINTVLVEADKIENLKNAYPNYFGDVQLFAKNLKEITKGKAAKEYTMPPQERVPPPPREVPDLSWFRRRRRWR